MPKWVERADTIKAPLALGMGTVLAAARPKNVLLIVAGAAAIASAGLSGQQETVAYVVFTGIATIGVAVPVVLYFALGDRGPEATRVLGDGSPRTPRRFWPWCA